MRPPWCGRCDEFTRLLDVDDAGTPSRCPVCHAATQPGGRHAPRTPRPPVAVALELALGSDD